METFELIATVTNVETLQLLLNKCKKRPDSFRVNSSHMEVDKLVAFLNAYKEIASNIPLYIDLQGAKLRVSRQQQPFDLIEGSVINVVGSEAPTTQAKDTIYVEPRVISLLSTHTHIMLDDGKLEISIRTVESGNFKCTAQVLRGGTLKSGKGFNIRPHPLVNTELTERDKEIVFSTKEFAFVRYALSFASLPSEIAQLRSIAPKAHIAAKLERDLTKEQLLSLSSASDSIWVCRGDMGVQLGFKELTTFYHQINTMIKAKDFSCPVVMAGEVMDHMCEHSIPTRAELCHLADLKVTHQYAGFVLSNETAFGKFPVECVDFCKLITE